MDEYTYYLDDEAFVTNRRVKLAQCEYDLADVKWVGVEEHVMGLHIGRFQVPYKLATLITTYGLMVFLFLWLFSFVPGENRFLVYALALLAASITYNLVMFWLGKRGHRLFLLGISGTFGMRYVTMSTNDIRLRQIAEAIKQAMRDRYASLQQTKQTPGTRLPRSTQ